MNIVAYGGGTDSTAMIIECVVGELNKAIAELNNRDRPLIKRPKPTIVELSQLAKQQHNPRQFYLDQLRSGAYRV